METKQELVELKGQISELEIQANAVVIATPEQNVAATNLKARLKEIGKQIKDRKEARTKPLNTALKLVREDYAPIEAMFEAAENIVGRKLLAYKQKVENDARIAAERIAARVEKGTMKIETAEKKMENLPTIQKTVQTAHGQVQFRKIPKLRVIDEALIPDKYWVIDLVALRQDVVVSKMIVPGAERYEEETV
jgi:hypothetical protein